MYPNKMKPYPWY